MAGYRTSTEVAASADVVWRVLSDVESMPEWTASMDNVEVVSGQRPPGPGTVVRISQPKFPAASWLIDAWEPPLRFAWTNRSPGMLSHAEHVVTPIDDTRCRVELSIEQTGWLSGLFAALTMRRTRAYVDMELAGLKARSEAEAGRG
ncbi:MULTISPECIES: SRPBCC family protein [unclassified Nocardioides]|uniref:SRPBCC family protein n=1 Tax=unclassified Nocardioides TaxID=2615069 RepID=UPI00361ED372